MIAQIDNYGSSEGVLKHTQLETLKSLSMLLLHELNSLKQMPSALES